MGSTGGSGAAVAAGAGAAAGACGTATTGDGMASASTHALSFLLKKRRRVLLRKNFLMPLGQRVLRNRQRHTKHPFHRHGVFHFSLEKPEEI